MRTGEENGRGGVSIKDREGERTWSVKNHIDQTKKQKANKLMVLTLCF